VLLDGIRVTVCEIGLAGPLCTRLLADLGADVVKIERPDGGDVTRAWATIAGGLSSGFVWVNRGKRSVALDVKDPRARPALVRLIARSDVFLQNFTPRWAKRVPIPRDERLFSLAVSHRHTGAGSATRFSSDRTSWRTIASQRTKGA
jgi:itaconate CoA-transferase